MNDTQPRSALGDVSANVRAEVARARMSTIGVIMQMSTYGAPMSRPKWQRRMDKPEMWSVKELTTLALILGIPLERLTAPVPEQRKE